MTITLADGRSLAFDRHGAASAVPLVLLHGLSSSRLAYAGVVAHLLAGPVARGEVQVVNLDLRGHGESSRCALERYDHAGYAADVAEVVERLGSGPALVVGHSLGGVTAASLATSRPDLVRSVLLEDPPLYEGDEARRAASPAASFFPAVVAAVRALQDRGAGPGEYAALAAAGGVEPDEVEARCVTLHRWDPATMEAALAGIVWRGYDPSVPLGRPVTVVRADPAVGAVFTPGDAEAFGRANPHARIVMVAGSAHTVHAPATRTGYLAELDRFLAER